MCTELIISFFLKDSKFAIRSMQNKWSFKLKRISSLRSGGNEWMNEWIYGKFISTSVRNVSKFELLADWSELIESDRYRDR